MPLPSCFTPRKETQYQSYRRPGGPKRRSGWMRKISPPPRFDPLTIQLIGSHYTNYAIPAHYNSTVPISCLHTVLITFPMEILDQFVHNSSVPYTHPNPAGHLLWTWQYHSLLANNLLMMCLIRTHTICDARFWLWYRPMQAVGQVSQSLLKKPGPKFSKSYLQQWGCVCGSNWAAVLEHNVAYIKPVQGEYDISFKTWEWKAYFYHSWVQHTGYRAVHFSVMLLSVLKKNKHECYFGNHLM